MTTESVSKSPKNILRLGDVDSEEITNLLERYALQLVLSPVNQNIPGSFWGDEEAGLIKNKIYVRPDTPIHSILHESCHYICMSKERRSKLHTDAGGTQNEENAVCYLQLLLCNELSIISAERMMEDMDSWGYNFMLGSCKAWFEEDAEDAKQWLINHNLINNDGIPSYTLRK